MKFIFLFFTFMLPNRSIYSFLLGCIDFKIVSAINVMVTIYNYGKIVWLFEIMKRLELLEHNNVFKSNSK